MKTFSASRKRHFNGSKTAATAAARSAVKQSPRFAWMSSLTPQNACNVLPRDNDIVVSNVIRTNEFQVCFFAEQVQ